MWQGKFFSFYKGIKLRLREQSSLPSAAQSVSKGLVPRSVWLQRFFFFILYQACSLLFSLCSNIATIFPPKSQLSCQCVFPLELTSVIKTFPLAVCCSSSWNNIFLELSWYLQHTRRESCLISIAKSKNGSGSVFTLQVIDKATKYAGWGARLTLDGLCWAVLSRISRVWLFATYGL